MKPGKCSTENSSDGLLAAICSNNPFVSEDIAWEVPKNISASVQVCVVIKIAQMRNEHQISLL